MAQETVHVLATYFAALGKEEQLGAVLSELVAPSRAEPGCLRYELLCSQDGYGEYVFVEEWESPEALEAHRQSEHLKRVKVLAQGSVGSLPRVNVFRRVR